MEIGEYSTIRLLALSPTFFRKKKKLGFFQTKLIWVGSGSGLGLGLGLEFVPKVVFWAFLEISLVIYWNHTWATPNCPISIVDPR